MKICANDGNVTINSLTLGYDTINNLCGGCFDPFTIKNKYDFSKQELLIPASTSTWEANTNYYQRPDGSEFDDNFAINWTFNGALGKSGTNEAMGGVLLADGQGTIALAGVGSGYGIKFCDANKWSSAIWPTYSSKSYENPSSTANKAYECRLERYVFDDDGNAATDFDTRAYYKLIINGNEYTYLGETKPITNYDNGRTETSFYNDTLTSRLKGTITKVGFGIEYGQQNVITNISYEKLPKKDVFVYVNALGVHSSNYANGETSLYFYRTTAPNGGGNQWFNERYHVPAGIYTDSVPTNFNIPVDHGVEIRCNIVTVGTDAIYNSTVVNSLSNSLYMGLLVQEGEFPATASDYQWLDTDRQKYYCAFDLNSSGNACLWGDVNAASPTAASPFSWHKVNINSNTTKTSLFSRKETTSTRFKWWVTKTSENRLNIALYSYDKENSNWLYQIGGTSVKTFNNGVSFYLDCNANAGDPSSVNVYFKNITMNYY